MKKKLLKNSLLLNKKIISNLKLESTNAIKGGDQAAGLSYQYCVTRTEGIPCQNSRDIECKIEHTENCTGLC